jgi:hypothetical protein
MVKVRTPPPEYSPTSRLGITLKPKTQKSVSSKTHLQKHSSCSIHFNQKISGSAATARLSLIVSDDQTLSAPSRLRNAGKSGISDRETRPRRGGAMPAKSSVDKPLRVNGFSFAPFSSVLKTSPVKNFWRAPEKSYLTRMRRRPAASSNFQLVAMALNRKGNE